MKNTVTLLLCVAGLYGSFLSWSVLQERINTKPYGFEDGEPIFFKAPLVVNIAQALLASVVGLVYSLISDKRHPLSVFTANDPAIASLYIKRFVLISITSSLSSPIGYLSLKHVDYLVFLLAKSCKLVPVMLVHMLFYRTKFPLFKYGVAGCVTAGVALFTLSSSKSKSSANDGNTLLGVGQLVVSMVLDGLMNSTQDQLFKSQAKYAKNTTVTKITGANLMCILNLLVLFNTLVYAVLFKYNSECKYAWDFVAEYPHALVNILSFAALGAIGQVFVFVILEKFDSIVLVTATVTRKMISMILSVVLFGHYLTGVQWGGVALVFAGIGYEAARKAPKKVKTV